jgi:hypothetical protein
MSEKKQPQWKKVSELRPGTHGHTLNLKVVKAQVITAMDAYDRALRDQLGALAFGGCCCCCCCSFLVSGHLLNLPLRRWLWTVLGDPKGSL